MVDEISGIILAFFIITYLLISTGKVNRTAMSLLGLGVAGAILWAANQSTFVNVINDIEWHTILFLTSIQIIVVVAASSGMFQYISIELVKPTHGDIKRLFITLMAFVFTISLIFDTTSTMIVMVPVTVELCKALDLDFRPFLISEAIICNFASIPSVIGSIPNIVIATEAVLDSSLMFVTLMPITVLLFAITIPILLKYYRDTLVLSDEYIVEEIMMVDSSFMIRSKNDFYASLVALTVLVIGITVGLGLGLRTSFVAIILASILLIFCRERVDDILNRVNWASILFLVGLFGLVAALGVTGIIQEFSLGVQALVNLSEILGVTFMTWIPAILSGVIDTVPVSALLAPVAASLVSSPIFAITLVYAVNIGGFLFPLGAPGNIIIIAYSIKEGKPIRLLDFLKIATPLGIIMLGLGNAWLLIMSAFI
ncbi:MAG: hypothetical protein AM326_08050 [Candidatus Thorarchaeota archaeon SMTZ-45]|nr:MAG: hypothetical protein AM325_05840 [Candidatus Thorarchaeota archaeon SMTZ1-45]KXH76013.1 MAG: hypothetical protein AM326_08050 [Candidatus Thorarchaeota archaeon SMTZ-45]